jgi:hypothetical protein
MAIKAKGTTLHISNEDADATAYATATFAKVGELSSISEPDGEAAEIDTTNLDSAEKEFLMGVPDSGSVTISGFYNETDLGQIEMHDARLSQQRRWIKITMSTGAIRYFKAVVKKFADVSAGVDAAVPFNGTLRISGAITRVAAP